MYIDLRDSLRMQESTFIQNCHKINNLIQNMSYYKLIEYKLVELVKIKLLHFKFIFSCFSKCNLEIYALNFVGKYPVSKK